MTRTEYPWLLPSAMADPELPGDRGSRTRRTVRDWIVDITAFLCAAGIGLAAVAAVEADETTPTSSSSSTRSSAPRPAARCGSGAAGRSASRSR